MRWISIHRERISSNRKKYFCRRYYYCSGCDFAVGKLVFKKTQDKNSRHQCGCQSKGRHLLIHSLN